MGVYPAHGQGDKFREGLVLGPGFFQESLAAEVHIFRDFQLLSCSFFENLSLSNRFFFQNLQLMCDTFLKISGSRPTLFRKSAVRFDLENVVGISWGLSPPHPHERGVPPPPTGRPRGGSGRNNLHLSRRAP